MEWLQKNQTAAIIDHHPQSKFLARKAQTAALLAFARTEKEYLQIVQTIIQSQDPKTVLPQSSSSDSTSPAISLGDDNEDDCFGILPPVKRHKKSVGRNVQNTFGSEIIHIQKVSPTDAKRRNPLTKGVPHYYKRDCPLTKDVSHCYKSKDSPPL
jgi:hypothetical protein